MSEIKTIPYSLMARKTNPGDKHSEKKVYATAQQRGTLTLEDLSDHMAEHTSSFSSGEIFGIVTDAVRCVIEHLKGGFAVELGALGKFSVGLSSDGADDAESFNTSMIRRVRVRYSSGKKTQSQMAAAQFEQVATRELQAKSRKDMRTAVSNSVTAAGGSGDDGGGDGGGGDITGGDDQTE